MITIEWIKKQYESVEFEEGVAQIKVVHSPEVVDQIEKFKVGPHLDSVAKALNIPKGSIYSNLHNYRRSDYRLWQVVQKLHGEVDHKISKRFHFDYFKQLVEESLETMSAKEIVDKIMKSQSQSHQLVNRLVQDVIRNRKPLSSTVHEHIIYALRGEALEEDRESRDYSNCALFFKTGRKVHLATYLQKVDLKDDLEEFLKSETSLNLGLSQVELVPRKIRNQEVHYSIRQLMSNNRKPELEERITDLQLDIYHHEKGIRGD